MHGRARDGSPARTSPTSRGSAIWARVISTRSHTPSSMAVCAHPGSTTLPWSTTAALPAAARRMCRHRSRLKPAPVWASGRYAVVENGPPRTTVMRSTEPARAATCSAAASGVTPAHGASSSQHSRTATSRSGPTALRTAPITSVVTASRSDPYRSPRRLVNPEWNWRSSDVGPMSISTPSSPASVAARVARANPSTRDSISGGPISIGISRLTTSATPDGAHMTDWE